MKYTAFILINQTIDTISLQLDIRVLTREPYITNIIANGLKIKKHYVDCAKIWVVY